MTTGIFRRAASLDRSGERDLVERRQHDAGDAARDEALDLGHLRVAIVFADRPAPDHLDAIFLGGTVRAGMDALPEHVRRPLRDDRNRQRRGAGGLRAVLCAGRRRNEQAGSRPANHRVMHNASLQEEVMSVRQIPESPGGAAQDGLALALRTAARGWPATTSIVAR